jgi:hypothetical protein
MAAPGGWNEKEVDARVRILAGSLEGSEGTVVRRCGNDRLLIHLDSSQLGVCVEIDAKKVTFLDRPLNE